VRVLKTRSLVKAYRKRRVVDHLDMEVREGEVVGLLGPNGAGKTTTFHMIVGLVRPTSGKILLDDEEISRLPMHLRARRGLGYLAQEPSIFRKLTVEENILAILETTRLRKQERQRRLDELLRELNIAHLAKSRAYRLSGGERRRVEIARSLVTSPSFFLLDEPFTGIDPIARADIQQIVLQLKTRGMGVLITDHNVRETLQITDRAYIIYDGRILLAGTAVEIAENPLARQHYLGESFTL
jgi:lipopolysaccharide export system ATP-binding protein